jgi:hypothetical protein
MSGHRPSGPVSEFVTRRQKHFGVTDPPDPFQNLVTTSCQNFLTRWGPDQSSEFCYDVMLSLRPSDPPDPFQNLVTTSVKNFLVSPTLRPILEFKQTSCQNFLSRWGPDQSSEFCYDVRQNFFVTMGSRTCLQNFVTTSVKNFLVSRTLRPF